MDNENEIEQVEQEENEPFSWDIAPSLLPPLFAAAERYVEQAPWQYLAEEPPLEVGLGANGPRPGVETLYSAVLGNDEMVTGLASYFALEGYYQALRQEVEAEPSEHDVDEMIGALRQMGAPVDQMQPDELREAVEMLIEQLVESGGVAAPEEIDSLLMYLNPEDDTDPTYLDWLRQHNIAYASPEFVPYFLRTTQDGDVRPLDASEVRALTLTLNALSDFVTVERSALESDEIPEPPVTMQARLGSGDNVALVTVSFPPTGYEWEDDEDEELEDGEDEPSSNGHS
jgi:hypothetical protein